MKKLISILLLTSTVCFYSAACSAKTSLTFFDTVVFESQNETTREDMLYHVLKAAEEASVKPVISNPAVYPPSQTASSLKTIMNGAANTFFRK